MCLLNNGATFEVLVTHTIEPESICERLTSEDLRGLTRRLLIRWECYATNLHGFMPIAWISIHLAFTLAKAVRH